MQYADILGDLIESSRQLISDIRPSDYAEAYRVMTSDVSPFPGPFSYERTPYLREIIDHLSPSSPAQWIAVKKGAQIGFTSGVIENGIAWIISENPANVLFLSGHLDLSEEVMNTRIDQAIESCGLRHLIRPNIQRKSHQRTGDTSKMKEFPGGNLVAGSGANHKTMRQRTAKYGFFDDFDAAKKQSTESGNTRRLYEARFKAYGNKKKIFYISTPELKATSNIDPVYKLGDQRLYHVPCPCCGDDIPLLWTCDVEGTDGREKGGITWQLDENGKLDEQTVGYICQKCGGFFDESVKQDIISRGKWIPTCEPSESGYYSYHISSLYAPPGMDDWTHYVRQYMEAWPPDGTIDEGLQQAFTNLVLGEAFEPTAEALKANDLQQYNIRDYKIGVVPDTLSLEDGNGQIVLLTLAADLNGIEQDARLDWEIVAWTETGASYSIKHGSIGTFVPRENQQRVKADRIRQTYEWGRPNSVWPELIDLLKADYVFESGKKARIMMAGIDTGRYTQHAYTVIDQLKSVFRVGLKGRDETKLMKYGVDTPTFKQARERANLYLVEVNALKDDLADLMRLRWTMRDQEKQPPGFMNYPTPGDGLYLFANFFSHYEAEHRITEVKDGQGIGIRWVKKNAAVQNHFWDVRIYSMALRDILVGMICRELKIKNPKWSDFVDLMLGRK